VPEQPTSASPATVLLPDQRLVLTLLANALRDYGRLKKAL
jgi:hypothetical protein